MHEPRCKGEVVMKDDSLWSKIVKAIWQWDTSKLVSIASDCQLWQAEKQTASDLEVLSDCLVQYDKKSNKWQYSILPSTETMMKLLRRQGNIQLSVVGILLTYCQLTQWWTRRTKMHKIGLNMGSLTHDKVSVIQAKVNCTVQVTAQVRI